MKNQIEEMKNEEMKNKLVDAIDNDDNEESVSLTRALLARGERFDLESSDGAFEELSEGQARWITSDRKLNCGDHTIAQWTVTGVGDYSEQGHRGPWVSGEDWIGGKGFDRDSALHAVLSVLDDDGVIDIDDAIDAPDVPEPEDAPTADEGQYAAIYTNDAGEKKVLARFAEKKDAEKAVDNYYRKFRSANGKNAYLADGGGWEMAELIEGKWEVGDLEE